MLQGCVGKVDRFKSRNTVGNPICCGSANDMFMNPKFDVWSASTCGSWDLLE